MRLLPFFIISLMFLEFSVAAQEAVSLQYGNNSRFVLPLNTTYQFPAFANGTIFLRNGTTAVLRLNYNVARDEVHFINENDDTLIVAEPLTISSIRIGQSRFFYDKNRWMQEVQTKAGITLAFTQLVSVQIISRALYSNSVSMQSKNNNGAGYFTGNGQKIILDDGRVGVINTTLYYYFGDKYGSFTVANKAHLLRFFERQQAQVREFIKDRHTNFNKPEDILEVMAFCDKLK